LEQGTRSSGRRQKQAADFQRNASKLPPSFAPIEAPLELTSGGDSGPGCLSYSPLWKVAAGAAILTWEAQGKTHYQFACFWKNRPVEIIRLFPIPSVYLSAGTALD
jgi:hypothetical protein